MFVGIDYGAQLAGTTVIAFFSGDTLNVIQSEKKRNSDDFISKWLMSNPQINTVFIDAPLSLPRAYIQGHGSFFYRECDQELQAMSPMFLGGLTARAIKLRHKHREIRFFECYPSALIQHLGIKDLGYKQSIASLPNVWKKMVTDYPVLSAGNEPQNWHQFDAILAWLTGWRFQEKIAISFGDPSEGCIWV